MEDLQKDNLLLKSLIATLQHQNEARNRQRVTLFQQIDTLTAQNDHLNQLIENLRKGKSSTSISTANQATLKQLKLLKDNNASLNRQFDSLKGRISSLTVEAKFKDQEIIRLNEDIKRLKEEGQKYLVQIQNSKQQRVTTVVSSQVINLQNEISSYKIKINQFQSIQRDLAGSQKRVSELQSQNRQLKNQKYRFESETTRLQRQIQSLKDDSQKYLVQIQNGREERVVTYNSSQVINLQNQINSYKIKISQYQNNQRDLSSASKRTTELEALNRQLQNQKNSLEGQLSRVQGTVTRLENQNRQLRTTVRPSSSQTTALLSVKLSLDAQIRQLKGRIEWLEGNNKSLQEQKSDYQKRLRSAQRQILEAKSQTTYYRTSEESYKNIESALLVKERQMDSLQQMIASLKQNRKYQEKVIRQKDELISSLESKLYTYQSSKQNSNQVLQKQIATLRFDNDKLQVEIAKLIQANQSQEAVINRLAQREQQLVIDIGLIRTERDSILRERQAHLKTIDEQMRQLSGLRSRASEVHVVRERPWISEPVYENQDLRGVIHHMQQEIQQLKNVSQVHIYNSNLSHVNKESLVRKKVYSPSKAHSRLLLSNDRDKHTINKTKWENLQRKINALRNENQSLKRTLFE